MCYIMIKRTMIFISIVLFQWTQSTFFPITMTLWILCWFLKKLVLWIQNEKFYHPIMYQENSRDWVTIYIVLDYPNIQSV